jgi:hypothetical protein
MTENPAGLDGRHVSSQDMQVGAADAGRIHTHDRVCLVGYLRVATCSHDCRPEP